MRLPFIATTYVSKVGPAQRGTHGKGRERRRAHQPQWPRQRCKFNQAAYEIISEESPQESFPPPPPADKKASEITPWDLPFFCNFEGILRPKILGKERLFRGMTRKNSGFATIVILEYFRGSNICDRSLWQFFGGSLEQPKGQPQKNCFLERVSKHIWGGTNQAIFPPNRKVVKSKHAFSPNLELKNQSNGGKSSYLWNSPPPAPKEWSRRRVYETPLRVHKTPLSAHETPLRAHEPPLRVCENEKRKSQDYKQRYCKKTKKPLFFVSLYPRCIYFWSAFSREPTNGLSDFHWPLVISKLGWQGYVLRTLFKKITSGNRNHLERRKSLSKMLRSCGAMEMQFARASGAEILGGS